MSRYQLDTGIAQDFIDDRHGVRERVDISRKNGNRIGICTPVLGELWSGIQVGETFLTRSLYPGGHTSALDSKFLGS
jgi:hypothetical protein